MLCVQGSVSVALTEILFTYGNLLRPLQHFKTKTTATSKNSQNFKYVRVEIFYRAFPAFVIVKIVLPHNGMMQYYIYFLDIC